MTVNIARHNCFLTVNAKQVATITLIAIYHYLFRSMQLWHGDSPHSGVGGGGAGGPSAPPKVLICRKFGQNS